MYTTLILLQYKNDSKIVILILIPHFVNSGSLDITRYRSDDQ